MSGLERCPKCNGLHYRTAPCIVRKPVVAMDFAKEPPTAYVEPETRPKRRVGRPKTITDMKAYKAQKEKERRQRIKAEKEAGK